MIRPFLLSLQFLTLFPIRISFGVEKKDFGAALFWFPVVGVLIGLALSSIVFLLAPLPQVVIAAIIVSASIIITGGIHLDGFADTCDGLSGFTTKERALEIMRDSRIGAMGAAGVAALLILKFSFFASIPREEMWKYLILMAAFGRWAQVLSCSVSAYARDDGKAKYFIEYAGARPAFLTGAFTLALFAYLFRLEGVILFFVLVVFISIPIKFIKDRLGGMTGDTIGAVNELAETALLFLGLLFYKMTI